MNSVILNQKVKTKKGGGVVAPARNAMTEDIVVDLKDMETYLEPEEYQKFLRAKQEVDEYNKRMEEYETKKAVSERIRDECRKQQAEAEDDATRIFWEGHAMVSSMEAMMPAPYKPTDFFVEHDRFIGLVREKKNEEKKRKEREERRLEALQSIAPPFDDAEKYLNKQEYLRFVYSLDGAADAYLDGGKSCALNDWRFDSRAYDYFGWTGVIKERKEKEAREKEAQLEYEQYLDSLSATVEKFKVELVNSKKPKFVYPPELEKYELEGWSDDLELPNKEQIQDWAKGKILEKLPQILVNVTRWELSWERQVLPKAAYEIVADIPCLTWYFDTHVLVRADLELKECVIRKRRPGYTVEVQAEGEKLGSLYVGPVKWLTPGCLATPIALLRLLSQGELEIPGITVIDRNPPFTNFVVQGLDEEVEVCDGFRRFIRDIATEKPFYQALLDKEIIDMDTAKLVEAKFDEPLSVTGKVGVAEESDLGSVVTKLVELGWTEASAKKAAETTPFPNNATTEEIVSIILEKSY